MGHSFEARVVALIVSAVGAVMVTTQAAFAVQLILRFIASGNYIALMVTCIVLSCVVGIAMWFIYHGFMRLLDIGE